MADVDATYPVARWLASVERDNDSSIAVLGRWGYRPADARELEGRGLAETERLYVKT